MKKLISLVILALGLTVATINPVLAEQITEVVPSTITLAPWIMAIVVGTVIPLVNGIITKLQAASGIKVLVNFVLVALGTVLNLIVTSNGTFVVRDALVLFATTFVIAGATYLHVWVPLGLKNPMPDKGLG